MFFKLGELIEYEKLFLVLYVALLCMWLSAISL
jgi:hypothetical protein